ncbi:MAG: CcdB family protein [Hyphomonas sp.]|uniref:CcdB family protein n=1 Tax=Hyphomonas sp. TaxID=87 RepID=UPI0034A053DC
MDSLAVFRLKRAPERLVLVLSGPQIAETGCVVAAPLMDPDTFPQAIGLNPVLRLGLLPLVLATEQMAAIPLKELGPQVGTCIGHEHAVANAINRLFFGI